jgi:hypothetical protein
MSRTENSYPGRRGGEVHFDDTAPSINLHKGALAVPPLR